MLSVISKRCAALAAVCLSLLAIQADSLPADRAGEETAKEPASGAMRWAAETGG